MSSISVPHILLAAFTSWVFYIVLRILNRKPFEGLPIIGHLVEFGLSARQAQAEWILAASKYMNNKSWPISIPGVIPSAIIVSDPACLRHIWVTKSAHFNKAGYFRDKMHDLTGLGILSATGHLWRAQRQAGVTFSTPATLALLVTKALPNHLPILVDHLDTAASRGQVVDLRRVVTDFVFGVFGEIGFDATWDEIKPLSDVFERASEAISRRFDIPGWPIWERIFPYGKQLRADLKVIRQHGEAIVQKVVRQMKEEELGGNISDPEKGLLIRNLLKEGLDEKIIVDSIINYTQAGRDTTAHAIVWGIYELLINHRVLDSLRNAIDKIPADFPISEIVSQVPLLEHTVSEIMRLHPSIPFDLVQLGSKEEPIPLPDETIVQPNDIIFWCPWAITRQTNFFGEDAKVFRPERWEELPRKPTPYEMPTFHAGPRSCLGQQMARLETAFVLVEIFKRFDLELERQERKVLDQGMAGEMKGGLKVRVTRRSEKSL